MPVKDHAPHRFPAFLNTALAMLSCLPALPAAALANGDQAVHDPAARAQPSGRIQSFRIDFNWGQERPEQSDGQWQELSRGTSVGRKKIDRFRPAQVTRVRLRITQSPAEPIIRSLAVFHAEGVSSGSLTTGQPTTASTFHSAPYVAPMATDDDPQTRSGCPDGTTACWLEVDLGAPTAFGRVAINELADRVRKFALEYRTETNTFNVNRTAQVTRETSSVLQVEISADGSTDCAGIVWIRSRQAQ